MLYISSLERTGLRYYFFSNPASCAGPGKGDCAAKWWFERLAAY